MANYHPWSKGKKMTDEFKLKVSLGHLGQIPWNKGLHMWSKGNHPRGMLGKKMPKEFGQRVGDRLRGIKRPKEFCYQLSEDRKGSGNPNWHGGVTSQRKKIWESEEYKQWRRFVFERDNYICQICGKQGDVLNADHIKSFAEYPELRFETGNGRTLCLSCHRKTDNYGGNSRARFAEAIMKGISEV